MEDENYIRALKAAERRASLQAQFAPKSRREAIEAKVTQNVPETMRENRTCPADMCRQCGGPRTSICKCRLAESKCAQGHFWYWCEAHGRRVEGPHDEIRPCGDHTPK
jgi:hypothetical protein